MRREEAIRVLTQLRPALQARGIAHASLFGSVARNQANSWSDIDVVVTPAPGIRLDLFDLGGVQSLLDLAFGGLRVDMVVEPIREISLKLAIERDRSNAF